MKRRHGERTDVDAECRLVAVRDVIGEAWETFPYAPELRAYIADGVWRIRLAVRPIAILASAATATMH